MATCGMGREGTADGDGAGEVATQMSSSRKAYTLGIIHRDTPEKAMLSDISLQ